MKWGRLPRTGASLMVCVGLVVAVAACAGTTFRPAAISSGGASGPSPADPTAVSESTDPTVAQFYQQKLTWWDCGSQLRCADVTVPLNWSAPTEETIKLRVVRKSATGSPSQGTLWVNPGGPGVSGVSTLRDMLNPLSGFNLEINTKYDLASWDTRGTGDSTPVRCLPHSMLDTMYAEDGTPDTLVELTAMAADISTYTKACQKNTGVLLEHVDTASTVRDMDVLRALGGDAKLHYLGYSYGTYLGAWYAEMYPAQVGHLVLDGAVNPALSSKDTIAGQTRGFSRAMQAYVDDCLKSASCPFMGNRQEAYAQLNAMVDAADSQPVPTDDAQRSLTQSLMVTGILQGMYNQQLWPMVSLGVKEVFTDRRGSTLLKLADMYLQRDSSGQYAPTAQVTSAIYCLDHQENRTLAQMNADAAALKMQYPPLGDVVGWSGATCALWPLKAVMPQRAVSAPSAAPIVVISTTGDPATPYEWGVALAQQLSSGVLLTHQGEGHTIYGQGNRCVDAAINSYLVDNTTPVNKSQC